MCATSKTIHIHCDMHPCGQNPYLLLSPLPPHLPVSVHNEQQLVCHGCSAPGIAQPFCWVALAGLVNQAWCVIQQHLRRQQQC